MFELRPLQSADILEIKDNLVEGQRGMQITSEFADYAAKAGKAYTCLKDDKVVACCGEIKGDIWALFSKSASCITRARAVVEFRKHLLEIGRAWIGIPSDLPNGRKYAEFIGGKFIGSEPSRLFDGIINYIYEVA